MTPVRFYPVNQQQDIIGHGSKGTNLGFHFTSVLSAWLMTTGALERRESRGSHFRSDYPELSLAWQCSIQLTRGADQWMQLAIIART